jgi:hypothetical protein
MGKLLLRLRPSPALVVASIALAVSLGGVGYAAVKLPRNSVGAGAAPQQRGLVVSWDAEWSGGTSSSPKTVTCLLRLDNVTLATRHSTNAGGYSDIAMNAVVDITPGSHQVASWCEVDTPPATIGEANATMIATE